MQNTKALQTNLQI